MSPEQWMLIALLAIGAYAVRLTGLMFGEAILSRPRLKVLLDDLPGCLVVALVAASLAGAETIAWLAAALALAVAIFTNNVVITMVAGFGVFLALQQVVPLL